METNTIFWVVLLLVFTCGWCIGWINRGIADNTFMKYMHIAKGKSAEEFRKNTGLKEDENNEM